MTDIQPRLTRIRFEARASGEQELRDYMMDQAAKMAATHGFPWEQEVDMEVQTTKDGYWARMTLKRPT